MKTANQILKSLLDNSLKKAYDMTRRVYSKNSLAPGEVESFLRRIKVCTVATVDSFGRPHAVPVSFVFLKGRFYVNTNRKSARYRHHVSNPAVAMTILDGYDSVMLQGVARVIGQTSDVVKGPIGTAFFKKYKRKRRATPDSVIVEIVPIRMFGLKMRKTREK